MPRDKLRSHDGVSYQRATRSQFPRQRLDRIGQQHAAAFRHPLGNHDALVARIEPLQRRMQQKSAAVVLGAVAGVRHDKEIRLQLHDLLQRGKAAEIDAEFAGGICQARLLEDRADKTVTARHPAAP